MKNNIKLILFGVLGVAVVVLVVNLLTKDSSVGTADANTEGEVEKSMQVDLNGDGKKEYLEIKTDESNLRGMNTTVIAFNQDGTEFSSLPGEFPILAPISGTFQSYQLISDDQKESFSLDFIAGPHQMNRMFFEDFDGKILPLCKTEDVQHPRDCLFYGANAENSLIVVDLDGDGYAELIEIVDEYPKDGELTQEELDAIEAGFADMDPEQAAGALRIAKRERGGRGRSVVREIYSFDGFIFEPADNNDFNRYFSTLKKEFSELVSRNDISQESIDYNEFAREFWQ